MEAPLGQDAVWIHMADMTEGRIAIPSLEELLLLGKRQQTAGREAAQPACLVEPEKLLERLLHRRRELRDLQLDRLQPVRRAATGGRPYRSLWPFLK